MVINYDVIGLDDYTPEELNACWYNAGDMQRMRTSTRSDAKMIDCGLLIVDNRTTSLRGLESRTREGMLRKKVRKLEAYAAVFSEIEFQQEEEFFDDELIADAYFTYSEPCALA